MNESLKKVEKLKEHIIEVFIFKLENAECGLETEKEKTKNKDLDDLIHNVARDKLLRDYKNLEQQRISSKVGDLVGKTDDEISSEVDAIIKRSSEIAAQRYEEKKTERQRWLLQNAANCLESYGEKKEEINTKCSIQYAMKALNLLEERPTACSEIDKIAERDKIVFDLNNEEQKKAFNALKKEAEKATRLRSPTEDELIELLQTFGVKLHKDFASKGGRKTRKGKSGGKRRTRKRKGGITSQMAAKKFQAKKSVYGMFKDKRNTVFFRKGKITSFKDAPTANIGKENPPPDFDAKVSFTYKQPGSKHRRTKTIKNMPVGYISLHPTNLRKIAEGGRRTRKRKGGITLKEAKTIIRTQKLRPVYFKTKYSRGGPKYKKGKITALAWGIKSDDETTVDIISGKHTYKEIPARNVYLKPIGLSPIKESEKKQKTRKLNN